MAIKNTFQEWFGVQPHQPSEPIPSNFNSNVEVSGFNIQLDFSRLYCNTYRSSNGYWYGQDNRYPQTLNWLFNGSPSHSYALNFKKLMTVGDGYNITNSKSLTINDEIAMNQLLSQYNRFYVDLAMDYFIQSNIYIKVTWNKDFTKIIKIDRIPAERCRINTIDEFQEPLTYTYCYDWDRVGMFKPVVIPAFDIHNKKDQVQIFGLQVKSPGQFLYPEATYTSAFPWIILDGEMGVYHKSNILNSVNPSVLVEIFKKPGSEEEKQLIRQQFNDSYAGARATGRAMIVFNQDVPTATKVTQMEANQLDETFLQLTDTIIRQIYTAHQINPVLLGVKTAGSLGDSGEVESAYKLFLYGVVKPAQNNLESVINEILSINNIPAKIQFKEADIFTVTSSLNSK